ncbi:MAG: prepilin-type N-terminal cleavage/methylation domain-containing protein [bacterium]|nr:prepilin-type N-terminal cleavage/methylation domain-containing protein [bacterium]
MNRQRGFTLLEVMVAVSILAVALTAIGGALGMVVRSTALASGYERARTVAENELALFLAGRPERPTTKSGVDNGVRWALRAEEDAEVDGLLRVVIEARFFVAGGDRSLVIETRETSRALPETETRKESS